MLENTTDTPQSYQLPFALDDGVFTAGIDAGDGTPIVTHRPRTPRPGEDAPVFALSPGHRIRYIKRDYAIDLDEVEVIPYEATPDDGDFND